MSMPLRIAFRICCLGAVLVGATVSAVAEPASTGQTASPKTETPASLRSKANAAAGWLRDAAPELGKQGHRANHASRRNAGSARMLSGVIVFCHVFAEDTDSTWSTEDRRQVMQKWEQATRFLSEQGTRYRRKFEFQDVIAPSAQLDELIPTNPQKDSGWTRRALAQATDTNAAGVVADYKKQRSADHVLLVFHVNKTARSYNISYYHGVPESLWAERLVCFRNILPERPTPAATYAHEILHGFGAGDLYFPFDQDSDRYLQAKELSPDDIMFRVDRDIEKLEVGRWTAYRVGWLKELDQRFRFMEDAG